MKCANCPKNVVGKRSDKRFCSYECRMNYNYKRRKKEISELKKFKREHEKTSHQSVHD